MDQHPDAGGLGIKMVDGKGNFLPESKTKPSNSRSCLLQDIWIELVVSPVKTGSGSII